MNKPKAHVAKYKKDKVKQLSTLLKDSKVVCIVNMENLPASALARIRNQLRGKAVILMSKRRLMTLAIADAKGSKAGLEQLESHLGGMPAFIFTDNDPFKLSMLLKKSRSPASAKPGQTAPRDLIIPAGPTPFSPGPIISELAGVGIKTGVEGGKVTVKMDTLIVREDEKITQKQSDILAKFGVKPMEVGISLVAVYDNGLIFTKKVLEIEPSQYIAQVSEAARDALGLAMGIGYMTKETSELMVAKAFRESKAVALSQGIFADLLAKDLMAMAERQANALKEATGQ